MNQPHRIRSLRVGDATVELIESKQHDFIGLGRVTIGGVNLRSDTRPITVQLETPDGIHYTRLIVEKIVGAASTPRPGGRYNRNRGGDAAPTGQEVEIVMRAVGVPGDRQEYGDDYGQPTVVLRANVDPVADRLTLILCPVALKLGDRQWTGFSYAFEFTSRTRQIHRLLTHATWEIGGRITGNTVLNQGQCNRPVYRGAKKTLFTTACLRTLDQHGQAQGNSYQLGPRAGLIQGFDFQHARQGALLQWWPRLESVSSLIESPPGSDLLHVVDDYRFELSNSARTTPKYVLFTPGPIAEHEARDLWWEAMEHVYGSIRKRFRVAPTVVVPEIGLTYETVLDGKRHAASAIEWRTLTTRCSAKDKAGLRMRFAGQEVHHTEVLYAMADHLLPRLAKQGIRRFMDLVSQSDVTELGMRRKLDDGIHGELHCSSVCATHRFFPSEFWGGMKAWQYFYAKGHALGMEIGHWFAPHFSARSPIFKEHPEYLMIGPTGRPDGGWYGPDVVVVADWNTGIYDWVLNDFKRWHDEGGLDYLFVDSYSNMGLAQQNYTARMRTNFAAFARLLADLQKIGIKAFTFESVSALGCARFGLTDLRGDLLEQNHAVAGQNDFGWWIGEEDMAFNCCLGVVPRRRGVPEVERSFFRALANRGCVRWEGLGGLEHILPKWCTRLNHLYNQALPYMLGRRRLLPDGAGVRWENADGNLVWTFKDWRPAGDRQVLRLDGKTEQAWTKPVLPAWNVFRYC